MHWWIDLFAPFVAGLAVAASVGLTVRALFPAPPERPGWHRIKPSGTHWFVIAGSSGFVGLMLYVRLFVGSARADAESQMQILTLLILAFAVCVVIGAIAVRAIIRADVRWRGKSLDYAGPSNSRATRDLSQVAEMNRRWTGQVVISFADGETLKLDGHADGVTELCSRIIEIDEQLAAQMPL